MNGKRLAAIGLATTVAACTALCTLHAAQRQPCTTPLCVQIKSVVKMHYCLPPNKDDQLDTDDECRIRYARTATPDVKEVAAVQCGWSDPKRESGVWVCRQRGEVPRAVRAIVSPRMRELGLPVAEEGQLKFTVLQWTRTGLFVANAEYSRVEGSQLTECGLIVAVDANSHITPLRRSACHVTDADVPQGTSWSLLDIRDVDGDGQPEVVLVANMYENAWFEVVAVRGGAAETVFAGLGYSL
jgi:hypothetical protein